MGGAPPLDNPEILRALLGAHGRYGAVWYRMTERTEWEMLDLFSFSLLRFSLQ